nr:2B [Tortoise rafivirus A]
DLAGALKSVSDKVTTEQVAKFVDSVKTISGTTEQISEQVTKSLNTFTGFFPTNPIVKLILKVVGYILILTSHPTPQVLMGLAMMGVADLGGSSSVTGILDWFYKKVGISKPEVEQTQ